MRFQLLSYLLATHKTHLQNTVKACLLGIQTPPSSSPQTNSSTLAFPLLYLQQKITKLPKSSFRFLDSCPDTMIYHNCYVHVVFRDHSDGRMDCFMSFPLLMKRGICCLEIFLFLSCFLLFVFCISEWSEKQMVPIKL